METTRKAVMTNFSLRADQSKLDRLRAIAEAEHHTLVSKLRVMIDREIAEHESERSAAA